MAVDTICFGVVANHTIRSLGASLTALDQLLTALVNEYAPDSDLRWSIWKLVVDECNLHTQIELLSDTDAQAPGRVGDAYLQAAIALATEAKSAYPAPITQALEAAVAACPVGGTLRFNQASLWIDIPIVAAKRSGGDTVVNRSDVRLSMSGRVSEVVECADPYAVVRAHGGCDYRCYLSTAQLSEARTGVNQRVCVSGSLTLEPDCPAQIAIRPADTFDVIDSPQSRARMEARRVELGLSPAGAGGAQGTSGGA